jgi:hypothetical protein
MPVVFLGILWAVSIHTVTAFYTRGDWSTRCTCSVGGDCKHAYAAGLAWMDTVDSGRPDGRDPAHASAVVIASTLAPPPSAAPDPALERELSGWLRALPTPEETAAAEASKVAVKDELGRTPATVIVEGKTLYPAEDYHQDFYINNAAHYTSYRFFCGRDALLRQVWGDKALLGTKDNPAP